MFTLKTAKVVGTPNGKAWSQVHQFLVEGEKLKKRGRLLVVLTLKEVGEGLEAVAAGREVLARINEEYYGNLEGGPFIRLKKTLAKLVEENENLELTAAVFYQEAGYFGMLRGGKVVIKRGSVIQTILELGLRGSTGNGEREDEEKGQDLLVGSGLVKEGDIFLLATQSFFAVVAEGTWRAALAAGEPEEAIEILAPIVAGREKGGGVAGMVVKIEGEKKEARGEAERGRREAPIEEAAPVSPLPETEKGVRAWLSSLFVSQFLHRRPRPVFVKRKIQARQRKKTLLSAAAILIFLLLISIVLGIRKRSLIKRQRELEAVITEVEAKLETGKALASLRPSEAKEIFQEARELVAEAEKLKLKDEKVKSLRKKIEKELTTVVREYRLSELSLFLDLSLVKEGAKGDDLGLFRNELVVLDKEGKRLIGINLKKRSSRILAGGEDLQGATQVAVWADKAYVFTEKGILETSLLTPTSQFSIPKNENWGEVVDLASYAGNLYLLDKKKNTIWRYLVTETGFGSGQSWFQDSPPDLSKASSLAIDGSIWVLKNQGSNPILKLTSGRQERFSITGLENPLALPTRIYTDDICRHLYILDKGNYRVVVLDKKGHFQASYLWAGMEEIEDLVVSEEAGKILLLRGSRIYEIEIK